MSLDITVGSRPITSLGPLKDLKSSIQSDFKLGPEMESQLDKPLSTLPANLRSVGIDFDGGPSWSPGNGEFTFSLTAGVKGKLAVMLGGDELLSYSDDFETNISIGPSVPPSSTPKKVTVPAGQAYVCVEFEFKIGGGISAEVPVGMFGIVGSVSDQNTFGNTFYRKCSPSETLHDAIGAAFTNFVLPLHPLTLNNLDPGDYLHHDFNACLKVGLGASIGYTRIFYGGQAASDLSGTATVFDPNPSVIPAFQASASLSFNFSYTGSFEALLWKDNATTGHMHLYRAKGQDTSLGLHLGVGLISSPADSAAVISTQLGTAFGKMLPGSLGTAFINKVLPKATDEAAKYAAEAGNKVAGWLKPINDAQATLDFAISTTRQTFILLDYTFDLTASAFASAWKTAVAGDFVKALSTPNGGVSIGAGGGMEKFYKKKTSIDLNLFGQLKTRWSDAIISNSSLIYAGNNTFHLTADVGRQLLFQLNNSKREIDLYFAAEADLTTTALQLGPIELHCVLQATNSQKFGNYIASFLGLITTGPNAAALVQSVKANALQPQTTQLLHLTFSPTAYGRLQASTITNGKPDNQAPDQQNYNAFAGACKDLAFDSPAGFTFAGRALGYDIWSNWNLACTGNTAPGALPDRTSPGSVAAGAPYLDAEFQQQGGTVTLIAYTLQAASDFMNLCADLKSLVAITTAPPQLDPPTRSMEQAARPAAIHHEERCVTIFRRPGHACDHPAFRQRRPAGRDCRTRSRPDGHQFDRHYGRVFIVAVFAEPLSSIAGTMNEPATIREILDRAKTIAVVGLTNREGRASLGVSRFMQSRGYRIVPVNPRIESALGERAYATLDSAAPSRSGDRPGECLSRAVVHSRDRE